MNPTIFLMVFDGGFLDLGTESATERLQDATWQVEDSGVDSNSGIRPTRFGNGYTKRFLARNRVGKIGFKKRSSARSAYPSNRKVDKLGGFHVRW